MNSFIFEGTYFVPTVSDFKQKVIVFKTKFVGFYTLLL